MKDAAVILSAIAGKCDLDSFTAKIPFNTIPDYGAACKPSLAGLRIGVPRKMVEADKLEDAFQSAFEDSFKVLEKLGATILDNVEIKSQEEWSKWSDAEKMYVLEGDFRDLIPKFLAELDQNPNNIRSIPDMMEATKNEPREEFEKRGYNRWEQCLKAPEGEALEARRRDMLRICKEDGILGALEEHSLDMLVIPGAKAELSSWAARAGLPITITPLGFFPGSQEVKMDESKTLVDVGPGVP
jgi:amidase